MEAVLIITALVVCMGLSRFFGGRHERAIRKLLAIDRICRKADVGEKDFEISPVSFHDIFATGGSRGYRHYTFEASAAIYPQAKIKQNPFVVIGRYEIDRTVTSRLIEDKIAEDIIRIREGLLEQAEAAA